MRHRWIPTALAVVLALGCGTEPTHPPADRAPAVRAETRAAADAALAADDTERATPRGLLVACARHAPAEGRAVIGPRGGTLAVGRHLLLVPAGALLDEVEITGRVDADTLAFVRFEPHGLQFRKPVALALDGGDCAIGEDDRPAIVYVNDAGAITERHRSVYLVRWKLVAALIDHFSGYAIAL